MKRGYFNIYYVKLFLYVITASLTALLSDLHNIKSKELGEHLYSPLNLSIIAINFILQGCIAWRAFIDNSEIKDSSESTNEKNPDNQKD